MKLASVLNRIYKIYDSIDGEVPYSPLSYVSSLSKNDRIKGQIKTARKYCDLLIKGYVGKSLSLPGLKVESFLYKYQSKQIRKVSNRHDIHCQL